MNSLPSTSKRLMRLAAALLAGLIGARGAQGGEIHGVVWEDVDGHGVVSLWSPVIAGVTIYLDLNQNGQLDRLEPKTVTNEYGRYLFADLASGAYKVTASVPKGWVQSYPTLGGELLFVGATRNAADAVGGLDAVRSVTVSPDGQHVYTAAMFGDAVEVFSRDEGTGELAFVQVVENGVDGVAGLDGAYGITLSSDGKHAYVTSARADALVAFRRDTETGRLTFLQVLEDDVDGVDGLDSARAVVISPGGKHVYTAAAYDDAVGVFSRDQETGVLTFEQVLRDGEGDVNGLYGVCALAASPDGKYIYTAGADDNALAVFSRDSTTGQLAYVQTVRDGDGDVDGLNGVRSVIVSPGGEQVYAAGTDDDAIVLFARDELSGRLEFVQMLQDDRDGVAGLWGVHSLVVSVDGYYLYATGSYEDTLVVFSRSPATGRLSFKQVLQDEQDFVDGLDGARSLAISPDGLHIYAAATYEDAVSAFRLEMIHSVKVDAGQVLLGIDFGIFEQPEDVVCRGGNEGCVDGDNGDSPSGPAPAPAVCGIGALIFLLPIAVAGIVVKRSRR